MIRIRRLLLVRYLVINYPSVLGVISTCSVVWKPRQRPSNPWEHYLLAVGSQPLTHLMKILVSVSLLIMPLEGLWILPMGARLVMFQGNEQKLDQQWETIERKAIKFISKFHTKIPNFKASAKIFNWVYRLWIRLLLVQNIFYHIWIQLLLVRKRQTQKHQSSAHKEKSLK